MQPIHAKFPNKIARFYNLAAMFPVGGFGVFHLVDGNFWIGVFCVLSLMCVIGSFASLQKGHSDYYWRYAFSVFISLALIYTSYFFGERGLIFVFPLIVGIFYSFHYRIAALYSAVISACCILAASVSINDPMLFRFLIAIALTLVTCFLFAAVVERQHKQLAESANRDYLTGLLSRAGFKYWGSTKLKKFSKYNKAWTVLHLDLDNFKQINDQFGQGAGDQFLIEIANRIRKSVEKIVVNSDYSIDYAIARLAGDEFGIHFIGDYSKEFVTNLGERFLQDLNKPVIVAQNEVEFYATLGVATSFDKQFTIERSFEQANAALLAGKEQGKNQTIIFDQALNDSLNDKLQIKLNLKKALNDDEFKLLFMPIFESNTLAIAGVEVLLRCTSDAFKNIGPDKFIPVAEQTGLIKQIDLWVIEHTFKKMNSLALNHSDKSLMFCINISAQEMQNREFPGALNRLIEKYQINPYQIELEITETSLVDVNKLTLELFAEIRKIGVRMSLDDFGTGYTAFNQLSNYPVDTLKIDRSFVSYINQPDNPNSSMADVIISIAEIYKMNIVAEGVETQSQLDYLADKKCQYLQGYFLSKPLEWADFVTRLENNNS